MVRITRRGFKIIMILRGCRIRHTIGREMVWVRNTPKPVSRNVGADRVPIGPSTFGTAGNARSVADANGPRIPARFEGSSSTARSRNRDTRPSSVLTSSTEDLMVSTEFSIRGRQASNTALTFSSAATRVVVFAAIESI